MPLFFRVKIQSKPTFEIKCAKVLGNQRYKCDKTKIGQAVKGTPAFWKQKLKINKDDTPEQKAQKEFYNKIKCDKKPYFFRYKYEDLNRAYKDYFTKANYKLQNIPNEIEGKSKVKNFKELLKKDYNSLIKEEQTLVDSYYKFLEKETKSIDTDCVMNNICHYIENIDFDIKKKVCSYDDFDCKILMSKNKNYFNEEIYRKICKEVEKDFENYVNDKKVLDENEGRKKNVADNSRSPKDVLLENLKNGLSKIESNTEFLSNYLIKLFYEDCLSYNKNILWGFIGKQIYLNVLSKSSKAVIPVKNSNGSIEYLYERYSLEEVNINKEGDTDNV